MVDAVAALMEDAYVPNEAALVTLPVGLATSGDGQADGWEVYVASYRTKFRLLTTSVPPVANVIVPSLAQPTRQWWRLAPETAAQDGAWSGQTDWYVNPIGGADENPGTVALPLRTIDEFFRRFEGTKLESSYRVYSAGPADVLLVTSDIGEDGFLVLDFLPGATTLASTTVAIGGFIDVNVPGQEYCLLTSANPLFDWTPYVGHECITVAPSAVLGVRFGVMEANPEGIPGVATARITRPCSFDIFATGIPVLFNQVLLAGDTIRILDLAIVNGATLQPRKAFTPFGIPLSITLANCNLTGGTNSVELNVGTAGGLYPGTGGVITYGCTLDVIQIQGCQGVWACLVTTQGNVLMNGEGQNVVDAQRCGFGLTTAPGICSLSTNEVVLTDCCYQRSQLLARAGLTTLVGDNGFFDAPGRAIVMDTAGVFIETWGEVFGQNLTGGILITVPNVAYVYDVGTPPTVNAGGAAEMNIVGVPVLYVALPYNSPANFVTVGPVVP